MNDLERLSIDAIRVLAEAGLHPDAVAHLREAERLTDRAARRFFGTRHRVRAAIRELEAARARLLDTGTQEVAHVD